MTILDVKTGEIIPAHPVADLFPMLADDELAELAEDIKERGLLQAIVLDAEGRILDGRNRLSACNLAGVDPRFETYEGDDPDGYALAANGQRRDLTKSKRAVIAARAKSLVPKKWGEQGRMARVMNISQSLFSQANAVLDHAPDLADGVVSGAVSLDSAYETAKDNKKARDDRESQMLKLRCDAPDLADLVTEEGMDLAEAIAALRERERKASERQRDARALLTRVVDLIAPESASDGFIDSWAEHLGPADQELDVLAKRADQAANVLQQLTERIRP